MIINFKNIISLGLSFFILFSAAHSHPHHGGDHSSPKIVKNIHDHDHDHVRSASHKCEDCLIKSNSSKVENIIEFHDEPSSIIHIPTSENFEKRLVPFRFNSRPPPSSHN